MPKQHDALFAVFPKLIGLVAVLPIAVGLTWLTWQVARETLEMTREWRLVQVEVIETPDYETATLAITRDGERREAAFRRAGDLRTVQPGESFPAYVNPANPEEVKRADGPNVWGAAAVVGFFAVATYGMLAFLLLTRPPRIPPELIIPEEVKEEEPASLAHEFAPIALRPAARRWKAAGFWAAVGLLALLPAVFAGDSDDLMARAVTASISFLWTVGFGRNALIQRGLEMRAERDRLLITHLFGKREIELGRVREVIRIAGDPGAFRFNDAEGRELFRLDADVEPAESLTRFLRRVDARIKTRSRFRG
jgi:hypothetical protein